MRKKTKQDLAAKEFVARWTGKGQEDEHGRSFWLDMLQTVFGVANAMQYVDFEKKVKSSSGSTTRIDAFIPSERILIEQKSMDRDLRKAELQSDGSMLTPFEQAMRYRANLSFDEQPRWIIVCNFQEFMIHNMQTPNAEPVSILLKDFEKEYYRLEFLVSKTAHLQEQKEVSWKAGEIVGKIYDAILPQYADQSESSLHSLNILCVRLVFCFYAEDAGIFNRDQFLNYLSAYDAKAMRGKLVELFKVLNQKEEERDKYLEDDLKAFPYTNGGLFAEEIEIPPMTDEIRHLLLTDASANFDWSGISPTIFGAVFESTLNPETRHDGGMHYTSIENIHKVIDPLFLDDLREELDEILDKKMDAKRDNLLSAYCKKLSELTFFDPACGSGNFLTETYLSIRRLENEAIQNRVMGNVQFMFSPIQVSIQQFYGIEINDFAVTVANTALWISEAQMMAETEAIIKSDMDFLPLKSLSNIHLGNSLRLDWNTIVPENLSYIIGNPPFLGFTYMTKPQKEDMEVLFPKVKNLDYVCAWYKMASDYIQGKQTQCAFVSTNSITQGETAARFAPFLNVSYNFAHRTFVWTQDDNKTTGKAQVHCVIIGFSSIECSWKDKILFQNGQKTIVKDINSYLLDAPDVIIDSRNKPLCNVPFMINGNKPADGGFLILDKDAKDKMLSDFPESAKFIRPFCGAVEVLQNKKRWCLWLKHASPSEIKSIPPIYERVMNCKKNREESIAAGIRKFSETPTLFAQCTQPEGVDYMFIPRVSSERRKYVPMGFLTKETIVSDLIQIVPMADLFHFGVLESSLHMSWMRAVAGRLKSDYRYSKDVVYNNFPWPNVTDEQKQKISETAQAILDARAKYPDSSLADLYDETLMPIELRKAHQANDKAVMSAYGFKATMGENEIVAELFKLYEKLTNK